MILTFLALFIGDVSKISHRHVGHLNFQPRFCCQAENISRDKRWRGILLAADSEAEAKALKTAGYIIPKGCNINHYLLM